MEIKIDTSRAADITVVCGSAGSGKSAWTKKQIKTAKRLIVWDIDDEYSDSIAGIKRITSIAELARQLKRTVSGRFCFVGQKSDFTAFCKCVLAWGVCVCAVEELATVTSPAKAPEGWFELVSRGRKYGVKLYGITQRPSESDKTIIGNASVIHVGRMTRQKDRAYMAAEMGISITDLDSLKPLEYIEKNMATGQIKRAFVKF